MPHPPPAAERVRFVGEPVAIVIAETQSAAQDAAEGVIVAYDVLPAVTDALTALKPGAPLLHDEVADNLAIDTTFGDQAAAEAAFAAAHLVIAQVFRNQRIASAHMEPRAAIGAYDAALGLYTVLTGSQGAVRVKNTIAACLGVAPDKVRAVTHDVGGAFGLLNNVYPDQVMVTWAARRLRMDGSALRRRNPIRRAQLPYRSATGLIYDSGNFRANMESALKLADWKGFPARRREAKKRGKLAGIGIANYVESPVGHPSEYVRLTVHADRQVDRKVEAVAGTQSSGQGHETTFAQVLADRLGISPEEGELLTGHPAALPRGTGTHSDRSMRLGGTLRVAASNRPIH